MYNNYNGDYLEGLVQQAKQHMFISKKFQSFKLRLLNHHDIQSMKSGIDAAVEQLKICNFYHYKTARKYMNINNCSDVLDKCLATDDILYLDEENKCISIDWTCSIYKIDEKVEKHKMLSTCMFDLVDYQIVVCMQNVDLWEDLSEPSLAKSMYKVLQLIAKEVMRKDYSGYIVIDVKEII